MIKKTTTYVDFDGNERTEDMYFNLTQTELMELAMELPDEVTGSVGNDPNNINEKAAMGLLETLGKKGVIEYIKRLVLKSYGIKSQDGRRFEKSEEISREFSQTIAFDNLMMELMTDDKAASDFMNSVIPSSVADKLPAGNKPALL